MLPDTAASKVTAAHLSRTALLYVRQSSLKQVIHNTESAIRQYDLRGKAIALGWAADQITVTGIDQGHSGASAADREGFQHLVAEVPLGRAGIVLGLGCSRLARNSADWHQLLELCGMTGTLICDEDGLYDPRNFNDRLLLGLKGALSEALCRYPDKASRGSPFNRSRSAGRHYRTCRSDRIRPGRADSRGRALTCAAPVKWRPPKPLMRTSPLCRP
jgi:Resolvase, N terminal domain